MILKLVIDLSRYKLNSLFRGKYICLLVKKWLFTDHGGCNRNATHCVIIRPAPEVRVNVLPMGDVQHILAVLAAQINTSSSTCARCVKSESIYNLLPCIYAAK